MSLNQTWYRHSTIKHVNKIFLISFDSKLTQLVTFAEAAPSIIIMTEDATAQTAQVKYSSYAMADLIPHTLNGVSEEQRKLSNGGENDNPATHRHN